MNIFKRKPDNKEGRVLRIVGFAPDTLHEAFVDVDKNVEIWAINNLFDNQTVRENIGRVTRWFNIHSRQVTGEISGGTAEGRRQIEYLNTLNIPVYVQELWGDIKNEVLFPAEEIIAYFKGIVDKAYFSSTVSWLLAFAIYEAYQECGGDWSKFKWSRIEVYGVNMGMGWRKGIENEYSVQRPSCEWILGIIHGLQMAGAKTELYIPQKSTLLNYYNNYGYETAEEHAFVTHALERRRFITAQIEEFENRKRGIVSSFNAQMSQLEAQINVMKGSLTESDYLLSSWVHISEGWDIEKLNDIETLKTMNAGLAEENKKLVEIIRGGEN